MSENFSIHEPMQAYAAAVKAKMTQLTHGEPEDQLRTPFENFISQVAPGLGLEIVCTGETPLPNRLGRPDYAVHVNGLLAGYVELKAPGTGATAGRFRGHNRKQFKRFSAIPNLLYTDGNEWALYRAGKLVGKVVRLSGDIVADGKKAAAPQDAHVLEHLLRDFFSWQPIIPTDRKGKIDLKGFAALLAPLTRMLRDDVTEALKDLSSPLIQLAKDWRQLLFPDALDEQFADAYAQTVAFALLLGRSEGADPLTLDSAEVALVAQHNLLSRALQVLTDPSARGEMTASLDLLLRIIAVVPPASFTGPEDPWLYFYEDFLAAYDPKLRKDAGAYYTPVEVVHCQVRLIDALLVNRLNKALGFADPSVITLDPATGTGTYLLGVIEHSLDRVETEQGIGAIAGQATELAKNLFGFELMVGPYAVSELRVSRALQDRGATLPEDGMHIYLTDTLESPYAEPPQLPLFLRPIAEQHAKALRVKSKISVIVCLGNPPYDRHEAATHDNKARTGCWIRWGDTEKGEDAILRDFLKPAINAGYGHLVRNIYNLYIYFWRWALWKVFEHPTEYGPGIVSFISASSYLDGDAFCGMREHMRRQCDEIWIIDLGGEGRGTRKSENIFAIQTPVAIAVAVRYKKANKDKPALVHYTRIKGTRADKLAALDTITDFTKAKWHDCPVDWKAPFRLAGKGNYFDFPLLTDLMPWQHSGVGVYRTWPIAEDDKTLKHRWHILLSAENRGAMFHETSDRTVSGTYSVALTPDASLKPIIQLSEETPVPPIHTYGFRSFDRQKIIADYRLISRPRTDLWRTHGSKQLYLASSVVLKLGYGPAITASSHIPDRHYFANRGGKDILPFYRNADCSETNILPGLLDMLSKTYKLKTPLSPENFLAYVYGTLAQPSFTARFHKELETRELRVPITKDHLLFEQVRDIGARLLWLHTYGERFIPNGKRRGQVPHGVAKCTKAVPGHTDGYPESFEYNDSSRILRVGEGEFAPVEPDVFSFEVSSFKVVQSWLKYRMKNGSGRKSSPLDDIRPEHWTSQFTTELLELLWVLEASVEGYPEQARLLETIIKGDCFQANELPKVSTEMRKPPKKSGGLFDVDQGS